MLRLINEEANKLQIGLERHSSRRPWVGVPLGFLGAMVLWALFWVAFAVVLALVLVTTVIWPVDRLLGGA